jgi:hypothetical protein
MRGLLREPLVHFLLGGAALFLLYDRVAGLEAGRPDRIVVSEDRLAMLVRSFERTWLRPPSDSELLGLIDDYVTEEVLYREALALGLDRDDLVVRRRMRQKLEFLNDDLSNREASEEELRDFLEANHERFLVPQRVSFSQVFIHPEGNGAAGLRAADLLARLRDGADPEALGDPTLLPRGLERASPPEVSGSFGDDFVEALASAPVGDWSGPVASSFGLHLVHVTGREPARAPPLEEVRVAVEREWASEERKRARERFYAELRARYDVEVRGP